MRHWLLILLVVSGIWGCTSAEKNDNTPEGLFKQGQEFEKDERYDLAIQRYQDVKNKFPYSALATQAELAIADSYYKQESFAEAQISYQTFKDLHPKHGRIDYVIFQLGMSFYKQLPSTIDRDLLLAYDGIKNFQELLNRFPTSEFRKESQERLDESVEKLAAKEAYIGNFYFKRKVWKSALPRFESLVEKFPTSSFVREGYSKAAISAFNLGESEKTERYYKVLSDRYSDSDDFKDARKALNR